MALARPAALVQLRELLSAPAVGQEDRDYLAAGMRVLLWAALATCLMIVASTLVIGQGVQAALIATYSAALVALLALVERGRLRLAGRLLLWSTLVAITATLLVGYGVHDVGLLAYPILVLFAGLLRGPRGAAAFALWCGVAVCGLVLAERWRLGPVAPPGASTLADAFNATLLLLLAAVLLALVVAGLSRGLRRARTAAEQLAAANQELAAKNAELQRFNYAVSHDLRSPLVTISAFLDLVETDAERGDVARLREDIGSVRRATLTMRALLDDLLELSRVGISRMERQPVELATLVEEALERVSDALRQRDVRVEVAPDLPLVSADPGRVVQLLQNLLDNAVKFMGPQPEPRIEIGWRGDGAEPVFWVRDNGSGLEPPMQTKVFGVFDRLDPTVEGTGVGLALAQRIAELHGGRLWVESEGLGRGSTFLFTLPAEGAVAADGFATEPTAR